MYSSGWEREPSRGGGECISKVGSVAWSRSGGEKEERRRGQLHLSGIVVVLCCCPLPLPLFLIAGTNDEWTSTTFPNNNNSERRRKRRGKMSDFSLSSSISKAKEC